MRNSCRYSLLLAVVLSVGWARGARAETEWVATHGLSYEELTAWIHDEAMGYRLVYLNGYDTGKSARFAAVAVKDEKNVLWYWWVGSLGLVRQKEAEHRAEGFRVISVSGFFNGNAPQFAVVWVKDGQPAQERIAFHLTEKEYTERINLEKKNNFMPKMVTGYADGAGSYRFTALFAPAESPWQEQHDLTAEQYQKAIDEQTQSGRRPMNVTVYPTPAGLRFAVVFIKDKTDWEARHGLLGEEYQETFERLAKNFRPIYVAGYATGKPAGPELFDEVMRKYMKERDIPAGTLAVSRDGKLLLARGYGFADREGRRRIQPDDPMRLASLVKPLTAAAIHTLIREGKLSPDAKAFPLLGLKPPPGTTPDPRLNDITIQHLLEHQGGWDRDKTFDPMGRPLAVAAFLKAPGPAGPVDIIRYMMGQPLQFDPGSKVSYSNFGYCVLGRVIEKVSGQTYLTYIQKRILEPLGAKSVELGRSLPRYRNPREPFYRHPDQGRNVLNPHSREEVPLPDGTFYLEAMDSHGGLIASSRDFLRFLDAYWLSGEPRQDNGQAYVQFGQLPGTFTLAMQRPNGVNLAAFFNQDADPSKLDYSTIRNLMRAAADRQTEGTLYYAALWVKNE